MTNIFALEFARLPNTTLEILLRLAKTLVRDAPAPASVPITEAKAALVEEIARARKGLTARLRAQNPARETSRRAFDHAVDGLWVMLRRELELQQAYAHAGLGALPADEAADAELDAKREQARRAQRVWMRMFAANGTRFTKQKFLTQTESMAALLGMLDDEQLRADLEAVVGEVPLRLLARCQAHYEHLASEQLSSERDATNLSTLRSDLRWATVAYVNAVQTLYKPKQPETGELVYDCLRSIVTLRELLARPGGEQALAQGEGGLETLDDELDGEPAGEEELMAESA